MVLAVAFTLPLSCFQAIAQEVQTQSADFMSSGDGSTANPYCIDSEEDLQAFAVAVSGYKVENGAWVATDEDANTFENKTVVLGDDVALTTAFTPIGIGKYNASTASTVVAKNIAAPFKGIFDGQGHTISNLYCTNQSNPAFAPTSTSDSTMNNHKANCFSALFGCLEGATVQNLNVTIAPEATFGKYGAGIAGAVKDGETKLSCVSVTGDINTDTTKSNVEGGLVGIYGPSSTTSTLTINNCFHNGKVTSTQTAGGLVGNVAKVGLTINSSYQYGSVTTSTTTSADNYWGVFIGTGNVNKTLNNCVTDQEGQLASANAIKSTTVEGCITSIVDTWNSNEVKAALGTEYFSYFEDGSIPPVFTSKAAKASYPTSFVAGADDVLGTLPSTDKIEEGTTFEIPTSSLIRRGYDFVGWLRTDVSTDTTIYKAGDNFVMPACAVEFTAQWQERSAEMTMSSEDDLYNFVRAVNSGSIDTTGKVYAIDKDIVLTKPWTPIGTFDHEFQGIFDGQNHTISGVRVTNDSVVASDDAKNVYAGFFGAIDGATIKNLGVQGRINASAHYAGGLVGISSGSPKLSSTNAELISKIDNCFSRVEIDSDVTYAGGLIGYAVRTQVSNSYAAAFLFSEASKPVLGGLIGCYKTIFQKEGMALSNCYADNFIGANSDSVTMGKLVGAISKTYADASTTTSWPYLQNCFTIDGGLPAYNVETSDKTYAACSATEDKKILVSSDKLKTATDPNSDIYLGAAFKAESSDDSLWINNGNPILAWEQIPEQRTLKLYVEPAQANIVLKNDTTGKTVETAATDKTQVSALYTFNLNSSTSYTVEVEAPGYDSQVFTLDMKSAANPLRKEVKLNPIEYSIAYNTNGASWKEGYYPPEKYTVKDNTVVLPTASDMEKPGYVFEGWYCYPNFEGNVFESVDVKSFQDYAFYAKWTAKTRHLSLDVNPNNAQISVTRADTGEEVLPNASGSFDLLVSLNYKVVVSAEGYHSYTFNISAGEEDIQKVISLTAVTSVAQDTRISAGSSFSVGSYTYVVQKGKKSVYIKAKNKKIKILSIPSSVKDKKGNVYTVVGIAKAGFKNCKKLKKVKGGSQLVTISSKAFYGCKKLSSVSISSKKLKSVSSYSFAKCKKLKKITIKSSKLNKKAFKGILKKSSIKTIKCKSISKKIKKNYKKWAKSAKKTCKVK